jgi:hypothetical protein
VALHGACHGVAVALAIAQACSRHDLRLVEPDFLEGDHLEDYQDLVEDFAGASDTVANITLVEKVVTMSSSVLSL